MALSRISITVAPELVADADRLASQQGTSRSAVVSQALELYVASFRAVPAHRGRVAETALGYAGGRASLQGVSDETLLTELGRRLTSGAGERPRATDVGVSYDRDILVELCRRHRIRRLSLFGSVLRDDFDPGSDVDVLVEFESGHTPGLGITDIEDELSGLFGDRRVDLVTPQSLHRLIRDQVLANAAVLYET